MRFVINFASRVRASLFSAVCLAIAALLAPVHGSAQSHDIYYPESDAAWEAISPQDAGWNQKDLTAALNYAGERNSSGVVILYKGKILAEQYWTIDNPGQGYTNYVEGTDALGHAIEDVASAQKSIAAILVGIAQERGFMDINENVSKYVGEGWSEASLAQENKITIRHLLTMTSGLKPNLSFEAEPGTKWLYNTPVYHFIMRALESATGRERNDLTSEWLTGPLGMTNSSWTPRPWASADIGVGFSTTVRDLARVGIFIQSNGSWKGKPVLKDSGYLHAMISPSQNAFSSYGYLWWLNGQLACRQGVALQECDSPQIWIPTAPDNLVGMSGALGRYLFIAPDLDLVVARLGASPVVAGEDFPTRFWELLLAAKK